MCLKQNNCRMFVYVFQSDSSKPPAGGSGNSSGGGSGGGPIDFMAELQRKMQRKTETLIKDVNILLIEIKSGKSAVSSLNV